MVNYWKSSSLKFVACLFFIIKNIFISYIQWMMISKRVHLPNWLSMFEKIIFIFILFLKLLLHHLAKFTWYAWGGQFTIHHSPPHAQEGNTTDNPFCTGRQQHARNPWFFSTLCWQEIHVVRALFLKF